MNESQVKRIWEKRFEAEVRSLYFAELAAASTTQKQMITGLSFFFSSGAAASVVAKAPSWLPVVLSLVVAAATAYSIAIGLDRRISTLSKLHAEWNALSQDYDRLWNHWYESDAEAVFESLVKRGQAASLLAVTDAPYKPELMVKWGDHVYKSYATGAAA